MTPPKRIRHEIDPTNGDADGRTLGEFDPMVWLGVAMMLLGFALLLILALLFHLGGWF